MRSELPAGFALLCLIAAGLGGLVTWLFLYLLSHLDRTGERTE